MTNYYPNKDRTVRLGRPPAYPWKEWTDGTERLLVEGKDFRCMAESFALLARRTARVRGLHVTVSTIAVPKSAKTPLEVKVNDEPQNLQPGNTYVLLKFEREETDDES